MPITHSYTGKFFLVAGIHGGREAFLGKAIDEPYEGRVTFEGKSVRFGNQGFLSVHPFTTLTRFPIDDAGITLHQIANPVAFDEVKSVFEQAIPHIQRSTHPLFFRWMETCLRRDASFAPFAYASAPGRNFANGANPFASIYEGFASSAVQFRRALFQAPQVHSTRELDKLTELEGNLVIEIGKVTNQLAIKLNQVIGRESELSSYFDAFQGNNPFHLPSNATLTTMTIGGWTHLLGRMQVAKLWARRNDHTALVRELNGLTKDGIHALNEVILEHCSALDILISETFAQYGITTELYGEMSPFHGYSSAVPWASESGSEAWSAPSPALAMATY